MDLLDHSIPITRAEPLPVTPSGLGEGPLWDPRSATLYWVDITGQQLRQLQLERNQEHSHSFDQAVCAVATTSDREGMLLALAKQIVRIDAAGDILEVLCQIEADLPENRCNDAKVDPAGRFWVGTMHQQAKPGCGSLYRIGPDRQPVRMLEGLSIPNGMAWSQDARTMFYVDSPTREIWAFDFDPSDSSIRRKRTVIAIPESMGVPDGMCIDRNGMLWVAHWGDGMVRRWNPSNGSHIDSIAIQDSLSTSCAFGGPNLDELFITSAADGQDSSGRLHHIRLNEPGGATYAYQLKP